MALRLVVFALSCAFASSLNQTEHYRRGEAIVLNIHVTHHAGTTFCAWSKLNGPVPKAAGCNAPNEPTSKNTNFSKYRERFHMIAWEYNNAPKPPLSTVNWEDPRVVSVFIGRDPIDRLLAGDGTVNGLYGGPNTVANRSAATWDKFLASPFTDSYALKILANGDVSAAGLERATCLASRFTFLLDAACLDANLLAMSQILGWHAPSRNDHVGTHNHHYLPARKRIANDTIWKRLVERNVHDIAFYSWLKNRSLVRCAA
eukprot:CAMPEP_0184078484 /NCGR_PEP_ID=MMETSP0974-20121125/1195_1 /TAXON_ID=483370 /ORGANISM="non described non described, Strain CCMP2097" /LENGTH=258 /DNA_ID=CAMNT_0026381091 /DNA_START=62 /DNA_END=838 /DNA_ORIENTATION=+